MGMIGAEIAAVVGVNSGDPLAILGVILGLGLVVWLMRRIFR